MVGITYSTQIRDRICQILGSAELLNISEVARAAHIHKITALKHLQRLAQEGKIVELRKGNMRLWRWVIKNDR